MSEHTLSPHAGASLKKWFGRLHRNRQLYVLILPAIISVFIFHYIPIYGVQVAFKDFRASMEIWGSPWVGLKHFARFFEMPFFGMMIRNTLSISLYSLATFPCAVIVALLLNELRNERFKKVVQMVSYAPHFVSTVVVCSMVLIFFDKNRGLANNVLALLGRERISFIETPKYFSSLYVWSGVWSSVGWNTIIYLAALSSISPEMIEAARIDGASQWKILQIRGQLGVDHPILYGICPMPALRADVPAHLSVASDLHACAPLSIAWEQVQGIRKRGEVILFTVQMPRPDQFDALLDRFFRLFRRVPTVGRAAALLLLLGAF